MLIRLKPGKTMPHGVHRHGLTLAQYYELKAGQPVEVEAIPRSLEDSAEEVTQPESEAKNGD